MPTLHEFEHHSETLNCTKLEFDEVTIQLRFFDPDVQVKERGSFRFY